MFHHKYCNILKRTIVHSLNRKNHVKLSENLTKPIVLGIETSCDDTGCAIVDGTGNILGEALFSQNALHVRCGGINPLVAHELHRDNIDNVVNEALGNAGLKIKDVDAIAVTTKPGLLISLQVGVKYAKYLAKQYNKPLIPIHHMEAHALIPRMCKDIPFPFIVLLVSGGHCLLAVVNHIDDFVLLGQSIDNAPGEVLDKIARRMKLRNIPTYSTMAGGRAVELAAKGAKYPDLFKFPLPLARYRDCNFSFSGIKDYFVRKLVQMENEHGIMGNEIIPEYRDFCAALQLAVAEHLVHRTERALLFCEEEKLIDTSIKNIIVSGGVACNDFIFKSIEFIANKWNYKTIRLPPRLCTDNGIMIAWNGVEKYKKELDIVSDFNIKDIDPTAPLGRNYINNVQAANLPVKATKLHILYDT
ncbi:probable tRNA N6-adenosine threonylcarbamoyltransferase, mitochondrial [Manduca sexta]|uniref:probable tRNA N6-adenosine threonylcarbamoyltransferase, mitochondrial n=1 Tax=Manduca sexta TaxID=7130 RepID=UPI00188EE413|nr:probable tRNA N6-adenosine threonylcarbamoyltransferase, mitochondrial [Manduca sexta]